MCALLAGAAVVVLVDADRQEGRRARELEVDVVEGGGDVFGGYVFEAGLEGGEDDICWSVKAC